MPTTANSITYFVAADGTLRDGQQGLIAQQPRINYGTEYAVTLSFPPSTLQEGDHLQVALNRTRTFFSSASATGDAPVAAVVKHDVTAEEAAAQEVVVVLSTNTRAMIDQVNGIDHPVRGFFGVHVLRGQSFVTLAVADALMMSLESGPDAISPSLPVVDYPTREEAEVLAERSETAAGRAEIAQGKAEEAQGKAETAEDNAQIWAEGTDQQVEELGGEHSAKEYSRRAGVSATNAEQFATNAGNAQTAAKTAQEKAEDAQDAAETAQTNAEKIAEGSDADVAPLGLEHSAKGWAQEAETALTSKRDILQTLVTSSSTALVVEAGKSYNWTVAAASTIALAAADKVANKETRIDIYIDLQDGGSVTGDGVSVVDAVLQSGWYKLIWDGTGATLYSTKAGGAASVITIPAATTAYTLQDNKHYQQVPSAVPTYTLPTATMDGLVHEITVLVDFMHVTSCSFVDASGVPVTLQSAISPQIGEAYIFRCYWYGKWRVVPLKIRNAATVSSATGVVDVSDAVAGDALALKMIAPRSVVVNQLVQNGNFADDMTGWYNTTAWTFSTSGNVCTATYCDAGSALGVQCPLQQRTINSFRGHRVILRFDYKINAQNPLTIAQNAYIGYFGDPTNWISTNVVVGSWTTCETIKTLADTATGIYIGPYNYIGNSWGGTFGDTIDFRNIQLVDLTQYFNGDQTLIDSITSWDDLVAYDPRFASYVEYNTGTVEGVQPTVKVCGKNLVDQNKILTDVANASYANGYYSATNDAMNTVYRKLAGGFISGVFKPNTQYVFSATGYCSQSDSYPYFKFFYTDGTSDPSAPSFTTTESRQYIVSQSGKTVDMVAFSYSRYNLAIFYVKDIQLELGSTATAYEPYFDGGTAQAPAPLFAVGNAADEFEAVAGVTTHKMASVDLASLGWAWSASGDYGYWFSNSINSEIAVPSSNTQKANLIHAQYRVTTWGNLGGSAAKVGLIAVSVNGSVAINTGSITQSPTGYLYYELAEPTTSSSTPSQISLQAGSNVAMQTDGGRTLAELALTYENLPSAN